MPSSRLRSMRGSLLEWYRGAARPLPWRQTRDPYAIWVSEVMLQQTRVETVVRYYDRFLSRFPTASALARASEDQVMSAWSGLGYYRRARNLHAGVREVVARYGGAVPVEPEQRRQLPGVGRYTAGAIGSIAFDRPEPIVDGNVARVLCRAFAIDSPLGRAATEHALWSISEQLVQGPEPGALNQALMELGATVCSKTRPACDRCPWQRPCRAFAQGLQETLPVTPKRKQKQTLELVAVLATERRAGKLRLWLARGQQALFGGLWNLPMRPGRGKRAARELCAELSAELAVVGQLGDRPIATLEHVLTHRHMMVQLWPVEASGGRGQRGRLEVFDLSGLAEVGISRLTRRAIERAGMS